MSPDAVVLDIGAEVGAAVITASDRLDGSEIEARPAGGRWDGRHVTFHRRRTSTSQVVAAVFPQLPEGPWLFRLRSPAGDRTASAQTVRMTVTGGRVTTAHYPD